jgi:hypothetical protein
MKLPLAAVCLAFAPALFCQPSLPSWLAPYHGAELQTKTYPALVEVTYTIGAAADPVAGHYRKLLAAQSLDVQANADGAGGTVLRAAAAECNLLITIRPQAAGTFVRVNCAAKGEMVNATHSTSSLAIPAGAMSRHNQLVAEMGIHRQREDAEAPPLVWPDWLVHVNGSRLHVQTGVDQAGNQIMKARYVTSAPMTEIFAFYKDQLTAHEYPVYRGAVIGGSTMKGVQQNANGYVEGDNYPNGSPGPRTEISIRFDRFHLNDPITVDLKFTTYAYKAPKQRF